MAGVAHHAQPFAYFLSFVPVLAVSALANPGSEEVRLGAVDSGAPDSSADRPGRGLCCWEGGILDVCVLLKMCYEAENHQSHPPVVQIGGKADLRQRVDARLRFFPAIRIGLRDGVF